MSQPRKPILAITMGDPTGIGPEIIAGAITHPLVRQWCRPVVVGRTSILRRASAAVGGKTDWVDCKD